LIELLTVMAIIAVVTSSVVMLAQTGTAGATLKATAYGIAANMREARASAVSTRRQQVVLINTRRRLITRNGAYKMAKIAPNIGLTIFSAEHERVSRDTAGVRFFPNGSSTGATLRLIRNGQKYDVRVDWLTGRVEVVPAK